MTRSIEAIRRLGVGATLDDLFAAINAGVSFMGTFIETFCGTRPAEATHLRVNMPPEFTEFIMSRKHHDVRVLEVVSRLPPGSFVCDRDTMSDADWSRIDGYRALREFGYGQPAALKLFTRGGGAERTHGYMALVRAADAPRMSSAECRYMEHLGPTVSDALGRMAMPLLCQHPILDQLVSEQSLGLVCCSLDGAPQESNRVAYEFARRYVPLGSKRRSRDALTALIQAIWNCSVDPGLGHRCLRHGAATRRLEVTMHQLHAETYDLPAHRVLVVMREVGSDDEAMALDPEWQSILSPRQRTIAMQLIGTGRSYKEIAAVLKLSEGTVRKHVERIYRTLDVHSRAELVLRLRQPRER
ncbi:helix-turn-helix transcriptional regulator [Chondromyces crocatus]|uniref:helix-turn-helix transcriptional regulator n=1 Tax=Chondromyces crocatus TaxID=52 RepID=UPI00067C0130|nr:LuxR C-terminal-related transcriptional regulator [Chondromyces crocatus]